MKIELNAFHGDTLATLVKMFAWMDICGSVGHSSRYVVFFDGDGAARLQVRFEDERLQDAYKSIREKLFEAYQNDVDPEKFSFE